MRTWMPINSRMPTSRRAIAVSLFLLGMLAAASTAPAQRFPSRKSPLPRQNQKAQPKIVVLRMSVNDDRITADIVNCPLQAALKELAHRTGVIFKVRSRDNDLVSVHLKDVSFQEAVERIASGHDTVFLYDPPW
jgi:hypothetical protein